MFRYLKAIVAAKRLLTLGGKMTGEIEVLDVRQDQGAEYFVLPYNADTKPDGIQSLFWDSRSGHDLVESLEIAENKTRKYRLIRSFGKQLKKGDKVWLSGWLGENPEDLGLVGVIEIALPNGTLAYFQEAGDNWVIHVHGRNASRAETLRNFKTINNLGFSQLSISFESDPLPAGLGSRRSKLGTTEWLELEAVIRFAYQRGANKIILFGFSLGAMVTGECLRRSSLGQSVAALILDSPLIDFEATLNLQAAKAGQSPRFGSYGLSLITSSRLFRFIGLGIESIPNLVRPLGVPALVFYSQTDGYVSMDRIPQLQALNPQSEFVHFPYGRHCRLYNQDPALYDEKLTSFLTRFQI